MKTLIVNFGQQHVILVYTRIAGQYLSELLDVGRLIDADTDANLSWLLRCVEHVYEEAHLALALGYRYRDAEERVEGVGLHLAAWTGQARTKLRLEYLVDEGLVAALVICVGFRCYYLRLAE